MSTQSDAISALVVRQWLEEWNQISFDEEKFQSRPPEMFLLASVPAKTLRRLSEAHRRDPKLDERRADDTSVQRHLDSDRSEEISRFVRSGYPISAFSARKRQSAAASLRKPGWLPTAIVVNILLPQDERGGQQLEKRDALRVPAADSWTRNEALSIHLPESWDEEAWTPEGAYPIEVIDGQHRLWAFSDDADDDLGDYDLPVVAFVGLDFSWQAYLFWTINIKPKKINASLAYDLYPLLRDQDWLEQGEGLSVYRETRAQELTEALWSYPPSVWRGRVNMLGRTGMRATEPVTQAAFVRAISESFVRSWKSQGTSIGGLFGGSQERAGLDWNRAQQAAFLIYAWDALHAAVKDCQEPWATQLRTEHQVNEVHGSAASHESPELDYAFTSSLSLLASDQGVRGVQQVFNDVVYLAAQDTLDLRAWSSSTEADRISNELLDEQLASLRRQKFKEFIDELALAMGSYDWRNAKAMTLTEEERLSKQALRGTGGYAILRNSILAHVVDVATPRVAAHADEVLERRTR